MVEKQFSLPWRKIFAQGQLGVWRTALDVDDRYGFRGGAAGALFREPAILLQLGWAPVQIRQGSNGRHRHPDGRQPESLPCHPDTLRDALRRVGVAPCGPGAVRTAARVGAGAVAQGLTG